MTQIREKHAFSLAAAILLTMVGLLVPNIQPIVVGAAADNLLFNSQQLGFLAGIETLCLGTSGLLAVFWVRRSNWHKVASLALSVIFVGNLATAFVADYAALLVIRGLTGLLGDGVAFALGIAIISEYDDTDRNFGIMVIVHVASMFIAMWLLPYADALWGMAGVFVPVAVLGLLLLPTVSVLPGKAVARATTLVTNSSSNGPVFWGLGAQLVWYIAVGGLWAFIERIGDNAGLTDTDIGLALAIGMGVSIVGSIVATWQGDRFGRLVPFIFTMVVQVFVAALLLDFEGVVVYSLIWFVFNLVWNYALPYMYAGVAKADYSGKFVVLVPTAQSFGLGLGASIAGMLIADFGLPAVIYLCFVANTVAALLFAMMVYQGRVIPSEGETDEPGRLSGLH